MFKKFNFKSKPEIKTYSDLLKQTKLDPEVANNMTRTNFGNGLVDTQQKREEQALPATSDFNELPRELKLQTAQYLSNQLSNLGLLKLARASEDCPTFFKPMIDVRRLLDYVVRVERKAVEAVLKQDMSLIFKRGFVTDCSGRKFESISAFEYALWALDKRMWATMMACIPQNEEGRKVFAQLIAQYNKVHRRSHLYA